MSNDDWGDTPLLEQVIQTCVDGAMEGMRTNLPGLILAYDKDSNRATVQVQVQESVVGESGERIAKTITIPDVPVAALGWGSVRIKIPVTKGSQCWLSFSSSCLTAWKQSGRLSDPKDDRRHHEADVIVQPLMSVAIKDDVVQIEFTDDGQILAGGSGELGTKADLQALYNAISGAVVVANDGGASLKSTILAALAGWPTGTSVLKGG